MRGHGLKLLVGGALVASAALAACGGGDDDVVERKTSTPRAGAAGAAGGAGKAGGAGVSGTAGASTGGSAGAGVAGAGTAGSAGSVIAGAGGAAAGVGGSASGAAGDAGAPAGGTSAGGQSGAAGAAGDPGAGGGGTSAGGEGGIGGKTGGVGGKIAFGGFGGFGTGGTSNGGAGGGVSPLTEACTAYATARCTKAKTCIADEPKRVYGPTGDADCIQLTTAECEDRANAPSSNVTPTEVQACATATNNATCPSFRSTAPLPACATVAGKAANDTPCSFDETCASKYCKKALTAGCGVCAAMPLNGADCTVFSCGTGGLVCKPTDKPSGPARTCQSASVIGQCDADSDCALGSYCPNTGFGIRTCKASGGLNASCNPQETGSCDAGLGLSCKAGTGFPGQDKCVANELANPGAACGPGPVGGNKICGGASECIGGKCVPHTVEGMTCDPTAGPACLLGFQCVAGQFGVKSCVDRGKQTCP